MSDASTSNADRMNQLESDTKRAFQEHRERLQNVHTFFASLDEKMKAHEENALTALGRAVNRTDMYLVSELERVNDVQEGQALHALNLVRQQLQGNERVRQLASLLLEIGTRDEKLKAVEAKIAKMVEDAETKYKDAITFLENANKKMAEQEAKLKEGLDYIG